MNQKRLHTSDEIYNEVIKNLIEDKGGSHEDYIRLMETIAFHESAGTLDPTIHQDNGGPGRGKYQFEGKDASNRILASANRTKNYFKSKGLEIPEFVKNIITNGTGDASTLSSKEQDILFLGDLRMKGGIDLKDYIDGNISVQDIWVDHWWAGKEEDKPERIKSFQNSTRKYNDYKEKNNNISKILDYNKPKGVNQPIESELSFNQPQIDNTRVDQRRVEPQLQSNLQLKDFFNSQYSKQENKFNSIDEGGRHEENPLGGVPHGTGTNGKLNTVEEGEASYDFKEGKFIFSDRLNLNSKN